MRFPISPSIKKILWRTLPERRLDRESDRFRTSLHAIALRFLLTPRREPGGRGRIRTFVARKERQIYSLLVLATHPPVPQNRSGCKTRIPLNFSDANNGFRTVSSTTSRLSPQKHK